MAWKRGQSGNPKGRTPGTGEKHIREVRHLAKSLCVDAILQLEKIGRDKAIPPQVRVNAWDIILQRGDGKPLQSIEMEQRGTVVHLGFLQAPPDVTVIGTAPTRQQLPEAIEAESIEATQAPVPSACVSNQPHSAAGRDDENA